MKTRLNMIRPSVALLLMFWLTPPAGPLVCNAQQAQVLEVIDGDTLSVRFEGKKERLRLIGVDTPESSESQKAWRDVKRTHKDIKTLLKLGALASHHTETLVKKSATLRLEFDVGRRDPYDRLLAYVYLSSGEMLNERLLADGYAQLMTVPPNVKYRKRFKAVLDRAKQNKIGLWAD